MFKKQITETERKFLNKRLTIAAVLLLALAIGMFVWYLARPVQLADTDIRPPVFDVDIDENVSAGGLNVRKEDEIREELNRKVAEGMINISMNMRPVFETGVSSGNMLIVNSEINRHMQVVEIYRDDTSELIYRSGGIPVGSKIEADTLDVFLPKGVYDCTAYFNMVTVTGELIGKAGAVIEITVLN